MTVPDWMLERLVLDDLSEAERAEVMRALESEEGGLDRLAAMRASDDAILERYPPRSMGARLRQRLDAEREPRRSPVVWVVPVLVAALAAVVALPVLVPRDPVDTYVGVKGEPRLQVDRKRAEGSERLVATDTVTAGDVLQLSYVAMGARHGVILSIDGAGVATLHFPTDGDTALDPEGTVHLPTAYRLDEAPGFERFFLVASDAPIPVDAVMDAGRALAVRQDAATGDLPTELPNTSLLLRKSP